jgi:D-sedoheptulose 7-phosphate isomerase
LNRGGIPAIALTTDTSILTAVGNDYGFEDVFRRQVEALGEKGDVLIGMSTSGKSRNVVLAMDLAREMGMVVIAFVGGDGGPVVDAADVVVQVPSTVTPRIQEGHITVGHILCDLVERFLFDKGEGE